MELSAGQLSAVEKLALLTRTASLLAGSGDFQTTLEKTIEACFPYVADFGFFDLRVDQEHVVRTARAFNDPRIEAILRPTQWVRSERSDMNLCGLSTGTSGFHPHIDDAWYVAIAVNEGHLAVLRSLAFRSMITVPLRNGSEVIGALTLFYGTSGRHHTEADVAFVEELTALVVPFVLNARLVESQRRVEEALRSSEERLRMAVDAGELGIWDWNIVTNEVVWSERVYDLHGLERGAFGGRVEDFAALVHEDDRARVQAAIEEAIAHRESYEVEFRAPTVSGVRWLATRARIVRDDAGAPLRMVGATYDVTSRVELLSAERNARERLEVLARAGELLSTSLDREATVRAIPEAVTPALADWCPVDLFDEDGALRHVLSHHADPDVARRGSALGDEWRAPATDVGSVAWVAENHKPHTVVFDEDLMRGLPPSAVVTFAIECRLRSMLCVPLIARGRSLGALTVLRDVNRPRQLGPDDVPLFTELAARASLALDNARLYAEAERARSEAEGANRAKDEFLAILGHELRNPLAPIVSALHLMQARADHSRERSVIERQVAHLTRLVDDLLDVSRIVRGKVDIARARIDLAQVVAKAVEMTAPLYLERRIRIEVSEPPAQAWVDGDPIRLAQIVGNLLTNAAKFSQPGSRVEVTLQDRDGEHELRVRDEGVGISADLLPNVFGLFVQGPQAIHRERGGLGLGLAIVKNLVEQHGGTVKAQSAGEGLGATFVVRLPAARSLGDDAPPPRTPAERARTGRVLVVDDNVDAGELLAELLRSVGYDVTYAPDGIAALESVRAARPEVAVLDIGLPGMDGYELARRLRADASLRDLRLIALTGYGLAADRARASASGFDLHLVKPVNTTALLSALDTLLAR